MNYKNIGAVFILLSYILYFIGEQGWSIIAWIIAGAIDIYPVLTKAKSISSWIRSLWPSNRISYFLGSLIAIVTLQVFLKGGDYACLFGGSCVWTDWVKIIQPFFMLLMLYHFFGEKE